MQNGLDLVEYAVDFAQRNGASYAEARFTDKHNENFTTRNGSILDITDSFIKGIGIRVIFQGSVAFSSTDELSKQSVEESVLHAIKLATLAHRKDPIVFSEEKFEEITWKTPVKIPFTEISREEKLHFLKNLSKRQKKEFGKKLSNKVFMLDMVDEHKYYVNNEGAKVDSTNSIISMYGICYAMGKKHSEQRSIGLGATKGWEWIKEDDIENVLIQDNRNALKTAEKEQNYKFSDPIDVVVSGEVAGIMCHENVGHPSEGDRILGREGAQAGESFYRDLWKGNFEPGTIKLGNECVTIIDDPTLPEAVGSYCYDDEGVKAYPRALIKNGMLNDLLLNREYGQKFNCKSSAAARAFSYNREPLVRMANTYMAPGDYELEELFEGIKKGIYMKSFTEWNIDDRRFQSKYVGSECYLIENGQLTDIMVRRPILELTTFGILQNIDAVAKGYFAPYGTCGKSDPTQGIPVSMGGAPFRIRNIRVGEGV